MSFFDDDPFENIVREFFGERAQTASHRGVIDSEKEERIIDFIEEDKNVYFVFELFGYSKEDINVEVTKKEIKVLAKKKKMDEIQDYLKNKLAKELSFQKNLPNFIKSKDYGITFKNGVLEVKFKKK